MPKRETRLVQAAGVVVIHQDAVLLIHRPRYDDWSFPKGKLDRHEHSTTAAVRETFEETSLAVRLGPALADQTYPVSRGQKVVHYWRAYLTAGGDLSRFVPNREVDQVRWVPLADAPSLLTYPHDRDTLAEAIALPDELQTLIVLRHANARSRGRWRKPDRFRPLIGSGQTQSLRLVPILSAYGAQHLVTSSAVRCLQTLTPYAEATGWPLAPTDELTEESASPKSVARQVSQALAHPEPVVLCSHRPTLVTLFDDVGLGGVRLAPGGMLVIHHRHGEIATFRQCHQDF